VAVYKMFRGLTFFGTQCSVHYGKILHHSLNQKYEIIAMLPQKDQATAIPRTENLVKFGHVVPKIFSHKLYYLFSLCTTEYLLLTTQKIHAFCSGKLLINGQK